MTAVIKVLVGALFDWRNDDVVVVKGEAVVVGQVVVVDEEVGLDLVRKGLSEEEGLDLVRNAVLSAAVLPCCLSKRYVLASAPSAATTATISDLELRQAANISSRVWHRTTSMKSWSATSCTVCAVSSDERRRSIL